MAEAANSRVPPEAPLGLLVLVARPVALKCPFIFFLNPFPWVKSFKKGAQPAPVGKLKTKTVNAEGHNYSI